MAYSFYLQKVSASGTAGTTYDLENDFSGLKYLKCDGLETKGKVKNIYTEDYPEMTGQRVFHPSDNELDVTYEPTTIELTLLFTGSSRRSVKASFDELLYSGRLYYWDTARNLKVLVVAMDEQSVEEDTLTGITYIKAKYRLTNINGTTL